MQSIIDFILSPWRKYKEYRWRKKKLKQLKDKDPFIYE